MADGKFGSINKYGIGLVLIVWAGLLLWFGHAYYWQRQQHAKLVYSLENNSNKSIKLDEGVEIRQEFKLLESKLTAVSLLFEATSSANQDEEIEVALEHAGQKWKVTTKVQMIKASPLLRIELDEFKLFSDNPMIMTVKYLGKGQSGLGVVVQSNKALHKPVFYAKLFVNQQQNEMQLMFRPEYEGKKEIRDADYFSWVDEISNLAKLLTLNKPAWVVGVMIFSGLMTLVVTSLFVYESWQMIVGNLTNKRQKEAFIILLLVILVIVMVG